MEGMIKYAASVHGYQAAGTRTQFLDPWRFNIEPDYLIAHSYPITRRQTLPSARRFRTLPVYTSPAMIVPHPDLTKGVTIFDVWNVLGPFQIGTRGTP